MVVSPADERMERERLPLRLLPELRPSAAWGRVAEVRGQLGFEHLLQRMGEQPGKDAFFAEEVVERAGTCELLLNPLDRW